MERSPEREPSDASRRDRAARQLRQGVIILPSAFTLGNLFFGVWSIVAASRGDLAAAGWFIVAAGVLDMLDGRVARFTRTGTTFGAELDSLVDAVSFGVAPGLIVYHLFLADAQWSWTVAFIYVTAVVVRLARFNIEQGGEAKTQFHGLPSPTAGMILATYYPFAQTDLHARFLGDLPWAPIMTGATVFLSVLMLSHVPYPLFPRFGFRTRKGLLRLGLILLATFAAVTAPAYFFFPVLVLYTLWGFLKSVLLGLLDRLPERDPLLDEEEEEADEAAAELRRVEYGELAPARFRRRGSSAREEREEEER